MEKRCWQCDAEVVESGSQFCAHCGSPLEQGCIEELDDLNNDVIAAPSAQVAIDQSSDRSRPRSPRRSSQGAYNDIIAGPSAEVKVDQHYEDNRININNLVINRPLAINEQDHYVSIINPSNVETYYRISCRVTVHRDERSYQVVLVDEHQTRNLGIEDASVSRKHLVLYPAKGKFWAEDSGSTMGTTVNGSRIMGPTALDEGDLIRIGANVLCRIEHSRNTVTVMKDSYTPISKRLAAALPSEMVLERNGRYLLRTIGLEDRFPLCVADTEIKLAPAPFSTSMKMNKELFNEDITDGDLVGLIKAGLVSAGRDHDTSLNDLTERLNGKNGAERDKVRKEIISGLGDLG
jgi:hypothetical protein